MKKYKFYKASILRNIIALNQIISHLHSRITNTTLEIGYILCHAISNRKDSNDIQIVRYL